MNRLDEDLFVEQAPGAGAGARHGRRIVITMVVFLVTSGVVFVDRSGIADAILAWYATSAGAEASDFQLAFSLPQDAFLMQLTLATWAGMLVAWPVASFRIWTIYHPDLGPEGARSLRALDAGAVAAFIAGATFAVLVAVPSLLARIMAFVTPGDALLDPYRDVFLPSTVLQENMKLALVIIVICALLVQVPMLVAATRKAGALARRPGMAG